MNMVVIDQSIVVLVEPCQVEQELSEWIGFQLWLHDLIVQQFPIRNIAFAKWPYDLTLIECLPLSRARSWRHWRTRVWRRVLHVNTWWSAACTMLWSLSSILLRVSEIIDHALVDYPNLRLRRILSLISLSTKNTNIPFNWTSTWLGFFIILHDGVIILILKYV